MLVKQRLNLPLPAKQTPDTESWISSFKVYSKEGVRPTTTPTSPLKQSIQFLSSNPISEAQVRIAKKIVGLDDDFNRAIRVPEHTLSSAESDSEILTKDVKRSQTIIQNMRNLHQNKFKTINDSLFYDSSFSLRSFFDLLDAKFPQKYIKLLSLISELDPSLANAFPQAKDVFWTREELFQILGGPAGLGAPSYIPLNAGRRAPSNEPHLSLKSRKLLVQALMEKVSL